MAHVEILHVVGALHVLVDVALACGPEGLDGVELVLLHKNRLAAYHEDNLLIT